MEPFPKLVPPSELRTIGARRARASQPQFPLRRVLAAPLQLIRLYCGRQQPFFGFLGRVVPYNRQESTEFDRHITEIEVAYYFRMSDVDWNTYQLLVSYFPLTRATNEMLLTKFDNVHEDLDVWEFLKEGVPFDRAIQLMSEKYNLALRYDLARPMATWPNIFPGML